MIGANRYNSSKRFIFKQNQKRYRRFGVLDVFDLYNFTVREDEPLEKEVAIDPEMLGKVFENLLSDNLRKGQGALYPKRNSSLYVSRKSINYQQQNSLLIYLPLPDGRGQVRVM